MYRNDRIAAFEITDQDKFDAKAIEAERVRKVLARPIKQAQPRRIRGKTFLQKLLGLFA